MCVWACVYVLYLQYIMKLDASAVASTNLSCRLSGCDRLIFFAILTTRGLSFNLAQCCTRWKEAEAWWLYNNVNKKNRVTAGGVWVDFNNAIARAPLIPFKCSRQFKRQGVEEERGSPTILVLVTMKSTAQPVKTLVSFPLWFWSLTR